MFKIVFLFLHHKKPAHSFQLPSHCFHPLIWQFHLCPIQAGSLCTLCAVKTTFQGVLHSWVVWWPCQGSELVIFPRFLRRRGQSKGFEGATSRWRNIQDNVSQFIISELKVATSGVSTCESFKIVKELRRLVSTRKDWEVTRSCRSFWFCLTSSNTYRSKTRNQCEHNKTKNWLF